MAKALFVVRAVVSEADRQAFDHWYRTDHLPLAIAKFQADRGWRAWSKTEPGVHYAFYEFSDPARIDAILIGPIIKELVADFDRTWGSKVTRTREVLEIAG